LGAGLALEGWERLGSRHDGDGDEPGGELRAQDDARAALERALDGFTGPLFWIGHDEDEPVPWRERGVWSHRARLPEPALAQRIWAEALGREGKRLASELHTLARDFRLPPGSIAEAAQEARARAQRLAKPLDLASLATAARAQLRHRLGAQATRVENAYRWEDLILSEELRAQLEELIARFKHRDRVLRDWGLGRRFGQELGLSALFEGPPGTGKTMSASLVAQALQRELFQVDLSRIVSRYVGETEKNLSRIFDEAEQAQAILLFDEADSLFAKRTEVRSSNDRYANLEVNYLLQRVERFSGVAILTTNFAASIDEAFARRLSMRVRFPKPEAEERERLWLAMLSEQRLPRGEVDCRDLGRRFELTGGTIRNAVLRAAFLAASRGGVLDQDLLDLAARLELKAQGTLVEGNPYDDLRSR
jgi:AAA+ superfamily predicted ATPase